MTRRPSLRGGPVTWYGGKGNLLGRLRPLVPHGRIYVEPYGGAASLLCTREPDPIEVYNDLDHRLVNLFRAFQDPRRFRRLRRRLRDTLYALDEFRLALDVLKRDRFNRAAGDSDELAWALVVAQVQAFASAPRSEGNWGRSFTVKRGMNERVSKWQTRFEQLGMWRDRLRRVMIDSRDAVEVIRYWDSQETVFYCDPPYVLGTRTENHQHQYLFEQPDDHHYNLVSTLLEVEGAAVVSGYDHAIYRRLEDAGWERREFKTACRAVVMHRANAKCRGPGAMLKRHPRTEVVWRNAKAVRLSRG